MRTCLTCEEIRFHYRRPTFTEVVKITIEPIGMCPDLYIQIEGSNATGRHFDLPFAPRKEWYSKAKVIYLAWLKRYGFGIDHQVLNFLDMAMTMYSASVDDGRKLWEVK